MRNLSFLLPALLAAALLGAGCEQAVEVDLPDHEPQLVVQSLFTPDSAWSAFVTHSVGYTESRDPGPVFDASIEVLEGDVRADVLTHVGQGRYEGSRRPQPGRFYTLRASAPGYAAVEATALLPPAPASLGVVLNTDPSQRRSTATITFEDSAESRGYYALDVIARYEREGPGGQVFVDEFSVGFESRDPILIGIDALEGGDSYFERAYFDDALFDGETASISITLFDFYHVIDAQDSHDAAATPASRQRYYVRLLTVDEAYFKQVRTLEQQDELGDNPFAEPVQVYSNMSNGFGVFAGYHTAEVEAVPQQ